MWRLFVASLVVLLVVGCGRTEQDDEASTPEATQAPSGDTPTPTNTRALTPAPEPTEFRPTPEPTPTPLPPPPTHPAGTRTGIAEMDAALDALESGDKDVIAPLIAYGSYPCEPMRPVQPQPLLCPEGMEPGAPLVGIWLTDVEAALSPPSRAPSGLAMLGAAARGQLWAAYDRGDVPPRYGIPQGRYALVFLRYRNYPYFDTVNLDGAGHIVSLNFSFLELPKDPIWVLPPLE